MLDLPISLQIILYLMMFLYGAIIGSFINVCTIRIPLREDIIKKRSHCDNCGYELKWYDLIPIFSYLFLKGRCRKCKKKISPRHLLMEVALGILFVIVTAVYAISIKTLLYCLLVSSLLGLSVIDFETYEIPVGFNYFIATLGVVRVLTDLKNWPSYLIGAVCVSLFLLFLYLISKGRAIGGGDVKLMAACGLLLGWKLIILSFGIGCILGAVIHLIRMKVSKESHVLALGPYLSMGVFIAALWGDKIIEWYLALIR